MQELTKYVLGVAAKSNVEKRQVGCIIVDASDQILAEGFNTEVRGAVPEHAEEAACFNLANSFTSKVNRPLRAYVTHPPCPACAKLLAESGVHEVKVIEAFMKFDGDKLRYDLVDGSFMETFAGKGVAWEGVTKTVELKRALWRLDFTAANDSLQCFYKDIFDLEEALARVLTFGARKYKANNWKECKDTGRYLAAAHRHLNAAILGEEADLATGFSHIDHLACNLMFLHVLGVHYDN